jgi:hypothetical protein
MKILKPLTLLTGLAFFAVTVSAQEKCTKDQRQSSQNQTDMIAKNVTGLTSDQKRRILTVEQDYAIGMQEACTGINRNKDTLASKQPHLLETLNAQIKTILNAHQYTQYMEMNEVQKGQVKAGNNK